MIRVFIVFGLVCKDDLMLVVYLFIVCKGIFCRGFGLEGSI